MWSSCWFQRLAITAAVTAVLLISWSTGPSTTSAQSDTTPEQLSGLSTEAGDAQVRLSWADPGDSTIDKYQLLQITQGRKLPNASTDDPVVRGDGFGISVAVDGNTAVIGAHQDDDDGANSGSAHVFTRSSPTDPWSWAAKLTAADAAENDEFGISVAVHGDTVVVGAHLENANDDDVDTSDDVTDSGAAYVFTKPASGGWVTGTETAKLTASDAVENDEFGISVAVHDETVVVGAHLENANDDDVDTTDDVADSGAAYVFTKPASGGWADTTETAKLTANDGAVDDEFGISVSVHGETVVVGAHLDDHTDGDGDTDDDEGAAYVFTKPSSGGWANATETAKLTAFGAAASDELGISVTVHGDTVVVGAHKYDVGEGTEKANAGAAYVFIKPTGSSWVNDTETAKLIASDAARGDAFGISVAVDDDEDTIVVGAYLDEANGDNSGSAYVFTQDSNGWDQKTKLTGPSRGRGDWLGHSVAVVGDTVIAGAERSNISGPDSGAVYLWVVPKWADINGSGPTTASHTVTGLTNGEEYSFQVRAVDKVEGAGAGPPSDPLRAMPLKPKPADLTVLSAVAGDSQVELSWNDPAGDSPPITNYQLWQHAEHPMLTADNRTLNDEFGYAVAIDGDTAVVGMPGEDNPVNSGAAFVFTRDSSGTWSPAAARLRASDPVDNVDGDDDDNTDQHRFGLSVAVHEDTVNGDTIAVGAPGHSDSKGAVYVFSEPATGWANNKDSDDPDSEFDHTTETAKFLAQSGAAKDEFGLSVAVDGNTIVVGAHENDAVADLDTNEGAAYVFTEPATGWANDQDEDNDGTDDHATETLKLSGSSVSDNFGRSVAIDGDTVVVGASGDDSNKGSALVFIKPDTDDGWTDWDDPNKVDKAALSAKLTSYSREDNDRFGLSVAIDGKTIVVGAYGDDSNKGSAFVFIEPATGWANSPGTQTAQLTASDRSSNDSFGRSVSVDGDTIVVGAHKDNIGGGTDIEGSAYVCTKANAGWVDSSEAAKLPGPGDSADDQFGWSVAIDRDTILVGADWQGGNDVGAAYLYDIQVWDDIDGSTGGTTSHRVTSLTNDVEHTFAVRAVNGGGAGLPAQASADTATPTTPPLKPRNFSAVQTGADRVRLEWGQVADPLNITGYGYKQDTKNSDGTWTLGTWTLIDPSDSATVSYTVSSLASDTTYTFTIRAVNSRGEGASSYPRYVTMVAAPAAPTDLKAEPGDEQVKLTWNAPTGDPLPIFTGYQYQQISGEDDFGDDWTDITETTTSHFVTGLANGTEYFFRVRSVNVTIGSTAVAPESATPSAAGSRLASPNNFNAEQTGVGQVELTWSAVSPPTTVTGYEYSQDDLSDGDDVSSWIAIVESDSGTNSHTVSGLKEPDPGSHTYRFAVRAVNSYTLQGFSSRFRDVTIDGEPLRPTGFNATAGDTQATVQWRVPSVPIDKYQLLQISISTLTVDDRAANDEFGYSVAIDGSTAVVGAYHRKLDGNANVGVAYVFTKDADDAWSQAATLTASDGAANDEFGISVAIDGNTIVVGARQDDTRDGAAYVFTKSPDSVWANDENQTYKGETAKLAASDSAADDEFGISVAIDGNTIVVGARQDDTRDGAAYVFTKAADVAWANDSGENHKKEAAKLTASDGAASDELGISVAIDGDTVVVGAHLHDINDNGTGIPHAGAAYVFTKTDTGGWANEPSKDHRTESARLTAPDGAAKDQFGISVAINVDTVVVGAHQPSYKIEDEEIVDVGPGAAYVFTKESNSGKWGQPVKLTASKGVLGDGFGISVAVDGNTAVVGAYLFDRDDGIVPGSGSAYVFARDPKSGKWSQTLNLAASSSAPDDRFGHSVAVSNDTVLAGVPQDHGNRGSAYAMDISTAKWANLVLTELTMSDDDRYHVYRVLNLTNDQQYAFRVRAVNDAAKRPSAETAAATPMHMKPVKLEGLTARAGDRRVTLRWDDPRDSSIDEYEVLRPAEQIKLTAGSDGETNGEFGESVAVDDGTAVVGAPKHNINGNANAGAAYVFTKVDGEWSGPLKLIASDGAVNDWFGYSVAVDGDTLVVGAYQHDTNDNDNAGAAYVFTRDSTGEWSKPVKLIAADGAANDWFGYSVAVGGDTVVIGARGHNGKTGAAYVFTKVGGVWGNTPDSGETHRVETVKLTASGGGAVDYFGHSVAMDSNTIVVGAHLHDVDDNGASIADAGAAYVFTRNLGTGVWGNAPADPGTHRIETAKLTAADADGGDQFGSSIAVDGNTVVVGARNDNAAYVFVCVPGSGAWSQAAKLEASDSDGSEEFGSSVAVRDRTIVVGADYANIDECEEVDEDGDCQDNNRSGAAYLFTKPANVDWVNDPNKDHRTESGRLTLPIEEGAVEQSDEFGNSVALDGQSIVVGAPEGDGSFGSVYVSDIPQWGFLASGGETTSATVGGLTNGVEYMFQVRAVDRVVGGEEVEGLPSDIRRATPMPAPEAPNRSPYFIGGEVTLSISIDEGTPPGTLVGSAVNATDQDGDALTYSLSGAHASFFSIDIYTGQISVGSETQIDYESGPMTYTVIVSVHDGKSPYNNPNTSIDDHIEVNIAVTNRDEAGTVVVLPEQPRVGTALKASLTDPDGSLSNTSWQWARSSDGSNWSDISGANSDTYSPVADDAGSYLRATASYTDGHGPSKSADAVSRQRTTQRDPSFEGDVTFTVDENTPPGSLVGDALAATDPDDDILTYSLSGTDASSFVIDGSSGQITVGSGIMLDYESGLTRYTVVVTVHDGRDAYGNDDAGVDDHIEVNIDINNVDEAGTVSVPPEQPQAGTALAASLTDLDGTLSNISWQWARSSDGSNWSDIAGANSDVYTPIDDDADKYLRVIVSYADGEGVGKKVQAVLGGTVQALPVSIETPSPTPPPTAVPTAMPPTATPSPTSTPLAVPSPTPEPPPTPEPSPTASIKAPVDDGGSNLWWIILIAVWAVAVVAFMYLIALSRRQI